MIPKTINYCWFGKNPLPISAERCIASWKKNMPEYEIKEWNEDNFDINLIPFTKEAANMKKYAFVSDYARLWILYNYGGIYFDTDVEVIKPLNKILEKGAFMGFEKNIKTPSAAINVNPGLGFACEAGNPIIKEIMDCYKTTHFIVNGEPQFITIVTITTNILKKYGLQVSNTPIKVKDFTIYPWEYFCPIEYLSNKLEITENTYTIHHYTESWMSWKQKLMMRKGALFNNKFGRILKRILRG